jgi:acyl carrier protein
MASLHTAVTAGGVAPHDGVTDRLLEAAASAFGVDAAALCDDSSPETVASWDSLNHLMMAMAVEGEFGIAFTPDEIVEMRTLGCVRAALRARQVDI